MLFEEFEVFDFDHFLAGNLLRSVGAVVSHHCLDLLGSGLARTNNVDGCLALETIILVDLQQIVVERHTVILGVCCNLADQADSRRRTFVAYSVVRQEAETLLTATDIFALAFPHTDTVGYPLEARIFVGERNTLCISNLTNQFAGNNGLDDIHIVAQLTQTLHVVDNVVVVHDVRLVAVDDHPLALVVAANDGYTVSIGVTGDNQIGSEFGT